MTGQIPLPRLTFLDSNGAPLASGQVYTYDAGATLLKSTWQDISQTRLNANPIDLDSSGSCLMYGTGSYNLTVVDSAGNSVPGMSGVSFDPATSAGISTVMAPVVQSNALNGAFNLLGTGAIAINSGTVVVTGVLRIAGNVTITGTLPTICSV